jgi:hypothetical protein
MELVFDMMPFQGDVFGSDLGTIAVGKDDARSIVFMYSR